MKNEKNKNKLNNLLNIININENVIPKKNKTSYKFFPFNNNLKNTKSSSLNNIFSKKDDINKKHPGYLYIKELENSKFFNFNNIFIRNINPKFSNSNNSFNKYNTIQKNNYIRIKKKSTLPYLYYNLYRKNITNKLFNLQNTKMKLTKYIKLSDNNSKESSFLQDSNIKNIYFNKNDNISLNNKIKQIYSKIKNNKHNKNKSSKNIKNQRYPVNRIELSNILKKNNSEIYYKRDISNNTNIDNEISLSDRTFRKESKNKNFKNNNFFYDKKIIELKSNVKDISNSKSFTNEKNLKDTNLINSNMKNMKNPANPTKISYSYINDKSKEIKLIKLKENKNTINKKLTNNNSRNDSSNECENEKETMSNNINEIEENNKNEIEKDLNLNDEQDKLFNTNQKNFFKFRKDIKEEPELEEDID